MGDPILNPPKATLASAGAAWPQIQGKTSGVAPLPDVQPSQDPQSIASTYVHAPIAEETAAPISEDVRPEITAYLQAFQQLLTAKYIQEITHHPAADLESLEKNVRDAAQKTGLSDEERTKIEAPCEKTFRESITPAEQNELLQTWNHDLDLSAKTAQRFEQLKSLHESYDQDTKELSQIQFSKTSIDWLAGADARIAGIDSENKGRNRIIATEIQPNTDTALQTLHGEISHLQGKVDDIIAKSKSQIAQNPDFADLAVSQSLNAIFTAYAKLQTLSDLLHEESSLPLRREIALERKKLFEKAEGYIAYAQTCLSSQLALAKDSGNRDQLQELLASANDILPQARIQLVEHIPISLDPARAKEAYQKIGSILQEGIQFQDKLAIQYQGEKQTDQIFYGKLALERTLNKMNDSLPVSLQSDPGAKPFIDAHDWFFDREKGALFQAQSSFAQVKEEDPDRDIRNALTEICLLEQIAAAHPQDERLLRKELVSKCDTLLAHLDLDPVDDSGTLDPDMVSAKLEGERHRILNLLAMTPLVEDSEEAQIYVDQAASEAKEMAVFARVNQRMDYFSQAQVQIAKQVESAQLQLSLGKTNLFENLLRANNRDSAFTKALTGLFQSFPDAQFDFRPVTMQNLFSGGCLAQFLITVTDPAKPNFGKRQFILTGVSPVVSQSIFSPLHSHTFLDSLGRFQPSFPTQESAPLALTLSTPSQPGLLSDALFPSLKTASFPYEINTQEVLNPFFNTTPRLIEITPESPLSFLPTGQNETLVDFLHARDTSTQFEHYGLDRVRLDDRSGKPISFSRHFVDKLVDSSLQDNPYTRDRYFADRLTVKNGEVYESLAQSKHSLASVNIVGDSLSPTSVAKVNLDLAPAQSPGKNPFPVEIEKLKGDLEIAAQHQQHKEAISIAEKMLQALDVKLREEKDPDERKNLMAFISETARLKAGSEVAMGAYAQAESSLTLSYSNGGPAQKLQAKTMLTSVKVSQEEKPKDQAKILKQTITDLNKSMDEKSPDGKAIYSLMDRSAFHQAELTAQIQLIKLYTQANQTQEASQILDQIIQAAGEDPDLETIKIEAQLEYGLALIDIDGKKALEILIPLSEKIHGEFESRTQYLYPLKEAISRCRAEGRFDDTDGVITIKDAWDKGAAFKRLLHEAASSSLKEDLLFTAGGAGAGVLIGLCVASGPAAPLVAAGIIIGIAIGTLCKWGTNIVMGADKISNAYHSGIDMVTTQQLTADIFSLGLDAVDLIPLFGTAAKAETTLGKMLIKESSKEVLERSAKKYSGGVVIRNLAQEAGKEVSEASVKRGWRNLYGMLAKKALSDAEKEGSVRFVKRTFRSFIGTWERRIQFAFPTFMFGYDSYHTTKDWMDGKISGEEWRRRMAASSIYAIRNGLVNRRTASLIARQFSESARLVLPPLRFSKLIPAVGSVLK